MRVRVSSHNIAVSAPQSSSSNSHMFLYLFPISCVQMCGRSFDGAYVFLPACVLVSAHNIAVSALYFFCSSQVITKVCVCACVCVCLRVCVCLHIISRCLGGLNAHPRALLRAQLSRPHSTWRPLHEYNASHEYKKSTEDLNSSNKRLGAQLCGLY